MAEESFQDRFCRQVTCSICSKCMVKPTKLIECFHTFCFTCIEAHLEEERTCPKCVSKVYDRDIDRPSLHRSLVVDKSLEEIINIVLPKEDEPCNADDWFAKRGLTPPAHRIDPLLTGEKGTPRCRSTKDRLSICLKCTEKNKLDNSIILVFPNLTIGDVRKAIAVKLFGDANMFKKVFLSVKGRSFSDDLTMIVIFVHIFKYKVPMSFDLEVKE